MKRIMAILISMFLLITCTSTALAAGGNMSSWFTSSTAQTMQIYEANENLMAYDARINTMMILYGIYDYMGQADVDLSNVEAPFSDVINFQPYSTERKALTWLYLKGVVKGYEDNTVKPMQEVTRAEFATMLIRMLENTNTSLRVSTGNSNPYNDINGHWAYDNIIKATNIGLVQGDGTSFNPNSWITKEEVITIGLRLADRMEIDVNEYADIVDDIYKVYIDYPISTDGFGGYDYSDYDYVINLDDYQNVYFDGLTSISSYTTSRNGIVTVSNKTSYLKVTAKEIGTVTITAKSRSGYQSTVKILVVDEYGNGSYNKYSYTVNVGSTQKVYHPLGNSIKSYSVTSGSAYITVTKYSNYLSVRGKSNGTAKIKIVDNYGIAETVTVKVGASNVYDDYYYGETGETIRVYPTSGADVKAYSVTSGSSYVTVTKYTSYLSVYCRKSGTAKIRITDTYGNVETFTIDVDNEYNNGDSGINYGITEEYQIYKGDYENIYFSNLNNIQSYNLSKSSIVSVTKFSNYLRVSGQASGTVTITVYDSYGNIEKARIYVDRDNYYEGEDYGITNTVKLERSTDSSSVTLPNLRGDLVDYQLSKTGIVSVTLYDNYIKIKPRNAGTVVITVYDEYGSSEAIKVYNYSDNSYEDDGSEPPYRDVIYPPDYEVDISK